MEAGLDGEVERRACEERDGIEATALQEQVLRAYKKIKGDEATIAKAKKALAIALTLLDDNISVLEEDAAGDSA